MPRGQYSIGENAFTSKEKIKAFFSALRGKYTLKETISDPRDHDAVFALLQGHVARVQKIGSGVKRFYPDTAPDHPNTNCFWVERIDGTITDFGVAACIDGIGRLNRMSLRECIRYQTAAFRSARGLDGMETFISDLSGGEFPVEESHVDHRDVTFEEIAVMFAKREDLDLDATLLTRSQDASSEPVWRNPGLGAKFAEFHSGFPLQLISRAENLSIKKVVDNGRLRAGRSV